MGNKRLLGLSVIVIGISVAIVSFQNCAPMAESSKWSETSNVALSLGNRNLQVGKRESKGFELQLNTGVLPIGNYTSANRLQPEDPGQIPACADLAKSPPLTAQQCVKNMFASYSAQGVKGLRIFIDFVNDGPFNTDNSLNSNWLSQLDLLLADMKAYGLNDLTITPVLGGWSGAVNRDVDDPCDNTRKQLAFYPTSPVAYTVWTPTAGTSIYGNSWLGNIANPNNYYECSPKNPIFIGWSNIYAGINAILERVNKAKLNVYEFDILNEINLAAFPASARFIYDNKHAETGNPDVYGSVRNIMVQNGYDPDRVTYSTIPDMTRASEFECKSVFGDSARLFSQSQLMAAISGQPFGFVPVFSFQNGLLCNTGQQVGQQLTNPIRLPVSNPPPSFYDFHAYHCVNKATESVCDTSLPRQAHLNDAVTMYNSMFEMMSRNGDKDRTFMLGETWTPKIANLSNPACSTYQASIPEGSRENMVTALLKSQLNTDTSRSKELNVIRPWIYAADANKCSDIYAVTPPY